MAFPLATLSSHQLLAHLKDLVRRGREVEADLLAHLAEVDARRLYLDEACSSMFVYCVQVLHFAEAVAYKRIAAARAARRHPELLRAMRRGDLHITAVSLLAPELTEANAAELIGAVRHRTAEQIRRLLADRKPRPDVAAGMRRAPEARKKAGEGAPRHRTASETHTAAASPAAASASSAPRPEREPVSSPPKEPCGPALPAKPPEPLGGERYLVRFTAGPELHAQLQELRALMRHQIPDGDLGKLLARAVAVLLEQVRKQKLADRPSPKPATPPTSPASRHIPAAIRRSVWSRDGGHCTFVSEAGRRCNASEFVEFHHRDPWARARVHDVNAISLLCRAHNQHEARHDFGAEHMSRCEARPRPQRPGHRLDSNPAGSHPGPPEAWPDGSAKPGGGNLARSEALPRPFRGRSEANGS